MKTLDVYDSVERACLSYAKHYSKTPSQIESLLADIGFSFREGQERKKPLKIRHTNTHAAMCCLED